MFVSSYSYCNFRANPGSPPKKADKIAGNHGSNDWSLVPLSH